MTCYFKNNKQCMCGKNYEEIYKIPSETCDVLCDDGITKCGGKETISVYLGWLAFFGNCKNS